MRVDDENSIGFVSYKITKKNQAALKSIASGETSSSKINTISAKDCLQIPPTHNYAPQVAQTATAREVGI